MQNKNDTKIVGTFTVYCERKDETAITTLFRCICKTLAGAGFDGQLECEVLERTDTPETKTETAPHGTQVN